LRTLLFSGLVFCGVFLAGIGALAVGLALGTTVLNPAHQSGPVVPTEDVKQAGRSLDELKAATVFIKVAAGPLRTTGSGFVLQVQGDTAYVVTNEHVIRRRGAAVHEITLVFPNGTKQERSYRAEVAAADPEQNQVTMKAPPIAAAIGSVSNDPLVISGVDYPCLGETVFFDVTRMQRLEVPLNPHDLFATSPRVFLRASADGRTFACQGDAGLPSQTYRWRQGEVTLFPGGRGGGPVPGPEGQVIFTDDGRYTPQWQPLGREGIYCWPAHHGPYYLSLPSDKQDRLEVYLAGVGKPLVSLDDVGAVRTAGSLPLDKRFHLIPDARLLVSIPASKDRLVLRRLDLEQALAKLRFAFVVITSRPPTAAKKGTLFRYPLQAKVDLGDAQFKLASGPPGMVIDQKGLLTWPVPADCAETEVEVLIHAKSSTGVETSQNFRIGVSE
jgi:hypothetical protein